MAWIITCPECDCRIDTEGIESVHLHCPECRQQILVPPPSIQPGTILDDFRILKHIGSGAMGNVFLAEQLSLSRQVALKTFAKEYADTSESIERFLDEARLTGGFDHPNIVTAFAAGEAHGLLYIAMSYVDGEDLDQSLRRNGPLSERTLLKIMQRIANALDYAWDQRQMVHRDLKPGNIRLTANGDPRLLDLGIARSSNDRDSALTIEGWVIGTPHYMSPEQARGNSNIDFKTDVYSLGATMYHLLSGQPPFSADTTMGIVTSHITEPLPPLKKRQPELSAGICRLVESMMQKDPEARPDWKAVQTEMSKLRKSRKGRTTVRPRPSPKSSVSVQLPQHNSGSRVGLIIGSIVVLMLIVGALIIAIVLTGQKPSTPPPPVARNQPPNIRIAQPPPAHQAQPTSQLSDELRTRINSLTSSNQLDDRFEDEYKRLMAELDPNVNEHQTLISTIKAHREKLQKARDQKQQIIDVMAKLDSAAQSHLARGDFQAAQQLYYNYKGPLSRETSKMRSAAIRKLKRDAAEILRVNTAKNAMQNNYRELFKLLTKHIQGYDFEAAKKAVETLASQQPWRDENGQKATRTILKELEDLQNANRDLERAYTTLIGKKVRLKLKDGRTQTLTVHKVKDGIIHDKEIIDPVLGATSIQIDIDDLMAGERLRHIPEQTGASYVLRGLLQLEAGDKASAKESFDRSSTVLGEEFAASLQPTD